MKYNLKECFISIHALREEGDGRHIGPASFRTDFYPRPPRGGRLVCLERFMQMKNFYPRPPRGGRRQAHRPGVLPHRFLSTPSVRRATNMLLCICKVQSISIHALREEGDSQGCGVRSVPVNFYPRPPRGGRLFLPHLWIPATDNFYPRPPRGGRLLAIREIGSRTSISIHALREEGDLGFILLSVGVRKISIHALREEGDRQEVRAPCKQRNYFYPRPPRGGRQWICSE